MNYFDLIRFAFAGCDSCPNRICFSFAGCDICPNRIRPDQHSSNSPPSATMASKHGPASEPTDEVRDASLYAPPQLLRIFSLPPTLPTLPPQTRTRPPRRSPAKLRSPAPRNNL